MPDSIPPLKEVDRIEITTVVDNYVSTLLPSEERAVRPPRGREGFIEKDTFLAEHGLCLWLNIFRGSEKHTVLMDTGYSEVAVPHNLARLGLEPREIETIVLSHGHMDHTGALGFILDHLEGPVRIAVHPDAFHTPRFSRQPDGNLLRFPATVSRADLDRPGLELVETVRPTLLAGETLLVTGQVERRTAFEKGMPSAVWEREGQMGPDPIHDDQSVALNLAGRGLVVVAGCAHSGIINTILQARRLTGQTRLHAVLGGFHLSGRDLEPVIEPTVAELKKLAPKVLVPMHCTGWEATHRLAEEFPDGFILNGVGTRIVL